MAFLRNDAINRVNLHTGILALAHGAGAVFVLAYLLRAGVSIPLTLAAQAAILAGRFVLRPAVLPLAKRWGLKPLLIFGTVAMGVQYPVLAEVDGVGPALFVLIGVTAVAEVFYYLAYNAYFATMGDAEHRGHQIGAREALVSVVSIVAPLIGAWMLVTGGPRIAFAIVGLIQAASALPLLGVPNVPVRQTAPGAFRAARPGVVISAIDGWFDASFFFLWQIALFVALRQSFVAYGGAMALAGLAGALCGLVLGRFVDMGHGRRAVAVAFSAAAAVVVLRAASLGAPWLTVIATALGSVVMPLIIPAQATASYNLAKASPCAFRFHMAAEGGWDVGCAAGCLAAAALVAAGASLSAAVLLALPGIAAAIAFLWRYYGNLGKVEPAAATTLVNGALMPLAPHAPQSAPPTGDGR